MTGDERSAVFLSNRNQTARTEDGSARRAPSLRGTIPIAGRGVSKNGYKTMKCSTPKIRGKRKAGRRDSAHDPYPFWLQVYAADVAKSCMGGHVECQTYIPLVFA